MSQGDAGKSSLRIFMSHGLSVFVASVFLWASTSKILEPEQFALQLKYYKVFPLWSLHLVALLVPWWELAAGVALLIPPLRKGAAVVSLALIGAFLVSVSQALFRGLDIECGCFGSGSGKVGWLVLAMDLGLLIATALVLFLPARELSNRALATQTASA